MSQRFYRKSLSAILLFLAVCIAGSWIRADAQESSTSAPTATKAKTKKSAKTEPEAGAREEQSEIAGDAEKSSTGQSEAKPAEKSDKPVNAANNKQPASNEKPAPEVQGPKLIEVPPDTTPYTPRPKVVAVFVFTDGKRIESDDYLMTKDALFITKDGQKTRYPVTTIDRDATKAANEGRGVVIVFPKSKSEFNLDF